MRLDKAKVVAGSTSDNALTSSDTFETAIVKLGVSWISSKHLT
jgi:hypothetical protein